MFDATEYYYSNILGYFPENEENIKNTVSVFRYLNMNGYINASELFGRKVLWKRKETLLPEDIPCFFWEGSLLKPDTFYYHRLFQLTPDMPCYDAMGGEETMESFYLEMRIMFSMNDLLRYFYNKCGIDTPLQDCRRDGARFRMLLERFSGAGFMTGIDLIMAAIDHASSSHIKITDVFLLEKTVGGIYDIQKQKAEEARAFGKASIIWRNS